MNHLELFSGIGGFRRAMELIQKDGLIPFSNVGYSEINDRAATTYRANYDTSHEIEIGDIVNFTSNPASIKKLPRIDIITGGFPCQAFSMMGNMMGFEEDRSEVEASSLLKTWQEKGVKLVDYSNVTKKD